MSAVAERSPVWAWSPWCARKSRLRPLRHITSTNFELNSSVGQQWLSGTEQGQEPRRAVWLGDGGVSLRLEWDICERGAGKGGPCNRHMKWIQCFWSMAVGSTHSYQSGNEVAHYQPCLYFNILSVEFQQSMHYQYCQHTVSCGQRHPQSIKNVDGIHAPGTECQWHLSTPICTLFMQYQWRLCSINTPLVSKLCQQSIGGVPHTLRASVVKGVYLYKQNITTACGMNPLVSLNDC